MTKNILVAIDSWGNPFGVIYRNGRILLGLQCFAFEIALKKDVNQEN